MKMNKIIIPVAALAMGVALVGSVSSTLAWYQYSTKAQAAFIGTSVGESENLEIKYVKSNTNNNPVYDWKTSLSSADINNLIAVQLGDEYEEKELIPITPALSSESASLGAEDALPAAGFYSGIETGEAGYGEVGRLASKKNYVQFKLNVRYKKTGIVNSNVATNYPPKNLKLIDLTINNATAADDLYSAVRVHFSTASNKSLFANYDKQFTTGSAKVGTNNEVVYSAKNNNFEFVDGTNAYKAVFNPTDSTMAVTITPNQGDPSVVNFASTDFTPAAGDNNQPQAGTWSNDNLTLVLGNSSTNYLETVSTNTYGNLDTDNDGNYDKSMLYEFETGADSLVIYGFENSIQSAKNAVYKNVQEASGSKFSHQIGVLPANDADGLEITVTIWLEGWQKLENIPANNKDDAGTDPVSAMWDPATYLNQNFNVGMRFQAEDIA